MSKIKKIVGTIIPDNETPLSAIIRNEAILNTGKKNWLNSASYWFLEAKLHDENREENMVRYCESRGYISLAIFCKRNRKFEQAAQFYESAYKIMSMDPSQIKKAILQLANSYDCKARCAGKQSLFLDASEYSLQASKQFGKLKNTKESIFWKYKSMDYQARDQASYGDFLVASEMVKQAADIAKKVDVNYYYSCLADSEVYMGRYFDKENDFKSVSKHYEKAAELFLKSKLEQPSNRFKGQALQAKAMSLKNDPKVSYSKVADLFFEASTYYAKSLSKLSNEACKICEADSFKYRGLNAKVTGKFSEAIQYFKNALTIYRELLNFSSFENRGFFQDTVMWYQGMIAESKAQELLLKKIQKRLPLNEVITRLAYASAIFAKLEDFKHADIDRYLIGLVMSIDAFHSEDYPKANSLIQEAKSRLPSDFLFSMLSDEINVHWQPLRYALDTIKIFDMYSRKLDTEKGYSFESRIRELLMKIYTRYITIESKSFIPRDEEVGIVFKDRSPIELDGLGTRIQNNQMLILVSEIKKTSKPIGNREVKKFIRKIEFIRKRYTKVAKYQALQKCEIEIKLFISLSGFTSQAIELLERNNVKIMHKDHIREQMRKHQLFPIP